MPPQSGEGGIGSKKYRLIQRECGAITVRSLWSLRSDIAGGGTGRFMEPGVFTFLQAGRGPGEVLAWAGEARTELWIMPNTVCAKVGIFLK